MVVNAIKRSFRSASLSSRRCRRLCFDPLESRTLLSSTLFVTASTPPDATHFSTLLAALDAAHSGDTIRLLSDFSAGTSDPTIRLDKSITLTADAGVVLPFNLEIANAATLSSLNLGANALLIDAPGATVTGCTLAQVLLNNADNAVLTGNTVNLVSASAIAVSVHNSANVLILNNTITTASLGIGIYASADAAGATTVDIRNNAITTTDGTGISLAKLATTASLQARVQGNDVRYNAMDVMISGDGLSAGNIDLGGGSTVFGTSTGGNNFMGKSNSFLSATYFAIGLFNTGPTCLVRAGSNVFATGLYSFPNALGLIVDSLHQVPDAVGTGLILVTTTSFAPEYLTATPAPITVADSAFSGTLASFASSASRVSSDFTAVIDWGDGTSSTGVITGDDFIGYTVAADHTWANGGNFTVTTIIESSAAFALVSSPAVVPPTVSRTLSIQPLNISAFQYDAFSGPVATFTDSLADAPANYSASVAWSDGLTTPGAISANADGSFNIVTSRTFSGDLTATVTLTTADNSHTLSATLTITVRPRVLTLSAADLAKLPLVQSGTFNGILASFIDNKSGTTASDYTATITWSDGMTASGTIAKSGGSFSISASRSLPNAGSLSATVTVSTAAGLVSASVSVTAAVAPRVITLNAPDITFPKKTSFSGIVATFTDNLPGTTAASYRVAVAWSDGVSTPATVTRNANGSFSISLSRSFPSAGIVIAGFSVSTTDGLFSSTASLIVTVTNSNDKLPPGKNQPQAALVKVAAPKKSAKASTRK